MRFFFLLGVIVLTNPLAFGFSRNCVFIDTVEKKIELRDFILENIVINGSFGFNLKKGEDFLLLTLDGKDIAVDNKILRWVRLKLIKKGEVIFINNFSSPDFIVKGKWNYNKDELFLEIGINSSLKEQYLEGKLEAKLKVWGGFFNNLMSGFINISKGRYKDKEFESLLFNLLGHPPFFNITDASLVLKDGTTFKIEGSVNIKDLANFFNLVDFTLQKLALGDWKLIEEKNSVAFKKEIDDRFGVVFAADSHEVSPSDSGAELRYKMEGDNFLKFRLQGNKDIVGFERRKEF